MPNTVLGKVSVTPKEGAWSSSSSYEKLDIVADSGNSYIALQNVPSGTALSNSSYWLMIAQKGDKGDKGDTGATGTTGATGNGISSIEVEETSVVGNVHTYTLTISMTDGTSEVFTYEVTDGAVTSVNGRTGAVTGLAEDDGYYENMTVGSADQLISSVNIEDKVPYVFRTSGGANDIGDREVDEIVGGTVAWNQLANPVPTTNHGETISVSNGKVTVSGTGSGNTWATHFVVTVPISHKILILVNQYQTNAGTLRVARLDNWAYVIENAETTNAKIISADTDKYAFINWAGGTAIDMSYIPQVFDLTAMFGSTVADYIYSLEQANAGAGVAWFKSLFPKPYYAHNAGQLISVSGLSAHKMTGFNQWDEDWTADILSSDGSSSSASNRILTSYVPVFPNTTYSVTIPFNGRGRGAFYDANKNLIEYFADFPVSGRNDVFPDNGRLNPVGNNYQFLFVPPIGTAFVRYNTITTYGADYKNDICINISWDGERDGEYEPYTVHEYALDSDVTLRGIPKLDADNKLYYDGDIYQSDGTVQRRITEYTIAEANVIDVTNLYNNVVYARVSMPSDAERSYTKNGLSSKFGSAFYLYPVDDANGIGKMLENAEANMWWFGFASGTTLEQAKTALVGTSIVSYLATPTAESADPYTSPQIVDDWGTEEYVIAEQSGVKMPVGHDTAYKPNLRAKLEMSPDSPSGGDGDYIVRQTNGTNEYVPLVIPTELPTNPSSDGTYILKATVSGGTTTLSWEVQS